MAASCISFAVASGSFAGVSERAVVKPAGRCLVTEVAPISISLSALSLSYRRSARSTSLAAWASDVEQETFVNNGNLGESNDSYDSQSQSEDGSSPLMEPPLEFPTYQSFAGSKLYVGNLPWTVDSQQVADVFQDIGNVELVEVIYDRETNRSRGFAFVTMSTVEDANAAIEKLDGREFGGRILKVNFPQSNRGERPAFGDRPRRDQNSPNKLFVGNLSWSVDDVSLENLFSDYGQVIEAKVILDQMTGKSRGFGFVTFSDPSEANAAINNLNETDFEGRNIRVNLAGEKPPPRAFPSPYSFGDE